MPLAIRASAFPAANDQRGARVDPRVARAVDAVRARLDEPWTVAKLARVAGMSRAAFARRFLKDLGVPPLRHVTEARLARVAERLVSTDLPLVTIATEVGYGSASALSRAFRRHVGKWPSEHRREARSASQVVPRLAA